MTSFFKANAFAVLLATAAVQLAGCTTPDTLEQDTTNTFIVVELMQGEDGTEIFSDVCVLTEDETGEFLCSFFNDNGIVGMSAVLKNQNQLTSSFLNDVTFTSYRVTFTRADGRNTPGVDVPYPFDGATNFLVRVNAGPVSQAFVLVRHQAKLEPPLSNLQGLGGALFISALAEIEFFGRDGAGRPISAKGFLNVHFGDFADE
ncbi:MAG TPA: hypothetical protein VGC53_11000 [Vicinamibacteria bacterium]|jgi:hypothetical protein